MRRLFLFLNISILLFTASILSAGEQNTREVRVDNEHIQTFRDRLGRWIVPGRESLTRIASRFGTTVNEIREINTGASGNTGNYIFVPMGKDVYKSLIAEGHGRRIYKINDGRLLWPVEEPGYTSRFGRRWDQMHTGLDFSCGVMSVVVAAQDGVVDKVGWMGSYGKMVVLQHESGLESRYAHNTFLLVEPGEKVKQGQIIALSGNTGRSTGPHVHFEVRYLGVALDPEDFLPYGLSNPGLVKRESLPEQRAVADNEVDESAMANTGTKPLQP